MTRSFTEINAAIARQLAESIGNDRFDMWFGSADSLYFADGSLSVTAPDELSLAFVRRNFGEAIQRAAALVGGTSIDVRFGLATVSPTQQSRLFSDEQLDAAGRTSRKAARRATRSDRPRQRPVAAPAEPPRPLLDNPRSVAATSDALNGFQFGSRNVMLETAVRQMLAHPGKFNPLVLHGPSGCGKTHLLQAMVAAARSMPHYRRCVVQTAEQFTTGFVEALQGKGLPLFRGKYRPLDLLALDDVQFLAGKRATLVEFQNTVESFLRAGRQLIVTSDRPLYELEFLGDSLLARLSCGMTCPVSWPDLAARETIARQHAREREFSPSEETLGLVCRRMARDVRLLKGAINRVHAATLAMDREIDAETANSLLADLFQSQAPLHSLEKIERVVCEVCGVQPDELRSPRRAQRVSNARGLAIWLSRRHTTAGLSEIGRYYGRDHSTVVAARKRIDALAESGAEIEVRSRRMPLAAAIERIEDRLATG